MTRESFRSTSSLSVALHDETLRSPKIIRFNYCSRDSGSRRHPSPPLETMSSTCLVVCSSIIIFASSLLQRHQHQLSSLEPISQQQISSISSKHVQEGNVFRVWSVYPPSSLALLFATSPRFASKLVQWPVLTLFP